jgi:hypothetical protein
VVAEAIARVEDYCQQRGVSVPELSQQRGTVLGANVQMESVARGVQAEFALLSVVTGIIEFTVTLLLWASLPRQHGGRGGGEGR